MNMARKFLSTAKYFVVTYDDVIMVDNQLWIFVHAYVVDEFYRQPILFPKKRLDEGASMRRLAMCLVDVMITHGGLTKGELMRKSMSFGVGGATIFMYCFLPSFILYRASIVLRLHCLAFIVLVI